MTYLQIVNSVLRRLRERQVAAVASNQYSTMLGDLINDAVYEVERAWDWSSLRATKTLTTADATEQYTLTGTDNQFEVHQVHDITNKRVLKQCNIEYIRERRAMGNTLTGTPTYYAFNGTDANNDTIVEFWPTPNGAYDIELHGIQRGTAKLTADSDVIPFPAQPVILLSWAKAIEERGEDSGVMMSSAYATASRALADAIAHDAARHPDYLIWRTV